MPTGARFRLLQQKLPDVYLSEQARRRDMRHAVGKVCVAPEVVTVAEQDVARSQAVSLAQGAAAQARTGDDRYEASAPRSAAAQPERVAQTYQAAGDVTEQRRSADGSSRRQADELGAPTGQIAAVAQLAPAIQPWLPLPEAPASAGREPQQIRLAHVEVDRSCVRGARPSGPRRRLLGVALRARDVLLDAPLRPQLGRAMPRLMWNDHLEANMQAIRAASVDPTAGLAGRARLLGTGAALMGLAALGTAALQGASPASWSPHGMACVATLVGAVVGLRRAQLRLWAQHEDAAALQGLARFAEDLYATRVELAQGTGAQGVEQLLHMADAADALGGSAPWLMHECVMDLDTVDDERYDAVVTEYHSRRLTQHVETVMTSER